jgi:signal transduction histidine kinase
MEQQVALRTSELSAANAELRKEIERRQQLERGILEISEREQRRIGQDLHDSIGQQLAAIKYLISSLEGKLRRKHSLDTAAVSRLTKQLDRAIEDVRGVSRGLHPVAQEPDGLMTAIAELIASVRQTYKISCRFECTAAVPVNDHEAATALYRIIQEAVNNVVRHASAKHLWINLLRDDSGVRLTVRDDGCGLPGDAGKRNGLGIRIMHYRASVLGATLRIGTAPGGGTLLECSWNPSNGGRIT